MEVGLGSENIVRWRPSSARKRAQPHPIFGPCLLWPNGWMDEDATWYGSRPRPRPHCVRRGLSSPCERGTAAPHFSARVYCDHGRPSQLLLSSCLIYISVFCPVRYRLGCIYTAVAILFCSTLSFMTLLVKIISFLS